LWQTPGFDEDLGLGVISNKNYLIETPQEVAAGIRKALEFVAPERIHQTSDCGLFAYARPAAKAKLGAMVKGADLVRQEVATKGLVVLGAQGPRASLTHEALLHWCGPNASSVTNTASLACSGSPACHPTRLPHAQARSVSQRARAGQYLSSRAPYGYRYVPKHEGVPGHLVIDEAEADLVRTMYRWLIDERMSIRQILKRLNFGPHRPRCGRLPWSASTVHYILADPIYSGTAYSNRYRCVPPKRPKSGRSC
jgi:hypothetical protein